MDIKEKEALLCSKYDSINRLLAIHNIEWQDREDLLHEIFFKALRNLDQLREADKMDAWLWSITRNEVNRYWRGIMKKREVMRSLDTEDLEAQMADIMDENYLRIAEELEHFCDRDELVEALRKLNEKTLILFRLYYFAGYKLKEIALIEGESESAIKSRHKRGLIQIREILEEMRLQDEKESEENREISTFPLEIRGDIW